MSWPMVALGEFFPKRNPSIDPKKFVDETFELFSIPAYDGGTAEIVTGAEIGSSKKVVQPGDVLLARIVPHIRRCWVVPQMRGYRQIGSGEWIVVRTDRFDPNFLRHFLLSDVFHAQFMQTVAGVGGSLLRARPADVGLIEIPLPPLDEQKRIAAILDKADALRRARERVAELRLSGLYGLFEAHFGSAPWASYKKIPLGEITTKIGSGATPKGGNSSYQGDEIALIRSMNVHDCRFKDDGLAFIDDDQAWKLRNVTVEADDVLLNITGASIARVCLVPETVLPARVNQHVAIIRAAAALRPSYLQSFLMHPPLKAKLLSIGEGGATRQAITKVQLQELEIPLPPLDQQLAFERAKHALLSVYALNDQSAAGLHALFTSLQHRAFAGELR